LEIHFMRAALTAAFAVMLVPLPVLALDCEPGLRPFTHAAGETCIPEAPQRIVAGRHDSIATPLIDIGAPVVGTNTAIDGRTGQPFIRGATHILGVNVGEASGIADIGSGDIDVEAVAALAPDLILLSAWESGLLDQMSRIAPTVVMPDNLPFLDHLAFVADAAGRADAYADRLERHRGRIEELREAVGSPEDISISRLDLSEGTIWYYPNWGAVDQVIDDVGFARPAILADLSVDAEFSVEVLPELGADIVLSSYADHFDQSIATLSAQWDAMAPFWREIDGVKEGHHHWYPRDVWVGYTFRSLDEVIDGLNLLAAGRSPA
jgi:iron complex transport system substrate-binding protein